MLLSIACDETLSLGLFDSKTGERIDPRTKKLLRTPTEYTASNERNSMHLKILIKNHWAWHCSLHTVTYICFD